MARMAFIIAAPSSGHGKTMITSALLRYFTQHHLSVQAFKAGPDYIDSQYHNIATNHTTWHNDSINLDPYAMSDDEITFLFHHHSHNKDIALIEGVMGLFDGPLNAAPTTAKLATILNIPIILVMDARKTGQTLHASYHGLKNYNPHIRIAGVIINRVSSLKHETMLESVFHDVPLRLYLHDNPIFNVPSRHLGLFQAIEHSDLPTMLNTMAAHFSQYITPTIWDIWQQYTHYNQPKHPPKRPTQQTLFTPLYYHKPSFNLAIAHDAAFQFIYAHLITYWQLDGVSITYFSPLNDDPIPQQADAIFLPGGYPELYAQQLAQATNFAASLRQAWCNNIYIYAECGGFMVLGQQIIAPDGTSYPMTHCANHITNSANIGAKKLTLGMRHIAWHDGPNVIWPHHSHIYGHEYHKSHIDNDNIIDYYLTATDSQHNHIAMPAIGNTHCLASFFHYISNRS